MEFAFFNLCWNLMLLQGTTMLLSQQIWQDALSLIQSQDTLRKELQLLCHHTEMLLAQAGSFPQRQRSARHQGGEVSQVFLAVGFLLSGSDKS